MPNRFPRRPAAVRFVWARLLAIVVAVLALSAQQRLVKSAPSNSAAQLRVVGERSQGVESNALRATWSVRVAPAPVLARLPIVSSALGTWRVPSARLFVRHATGVGPAQFVTHFHAKRRIPRMNSEEPPRA